MENKKNEENLIERENNLFMMFITSLLLITISVVIFLFTSEVQDKFTFKFAQQTVFIKNKGIEEYTIRKLKDKLNFLFSAKGEYELQLFTEKIILLKNKETLNKTILNFFKKQRIIGTNIKILQITKIYGKQKEIKGNHKIFLETNSKYRVYIRSRDYEETKEPKYYTIDVIINSLGKILDAKFYINDNLKEFYSALKIAKVLNLRTLPNFINQKAKNKIAIRNLFVKPTGTEFTLKEVIYTKAQIRIIVSIDNKIYALIYKKGEIINVIKIKNYEE